MKTFDNAGDLAINGAPPAFEEPLHVGRPNIGDRRTFFDLVNGILDRRWLSNNGPVVQEFERRLEKYLGVKHCIAMCNGTVALEIAIRALGLTGEVIVPSYTFIATAHALHWQEITPVFADIDPTTHSLDPDAVRRMITPRTTGIIGVHLWGRPCDVNSLEEVAGDYGLSLMFDAAHAFGNSSQGRMIGGFGACEVFSFHATKFFNTFEGGAVVTNDDSLAEKVRLMCNFGFAGLDNVIYPGTNGKMSEIAAAMGLTNLQSLPDIVEANRCNFVAYSSEFKSIEAVHLLEYDPSERNNYQYIVVELAQDFPISRDKVVDALRAENILARRYFWPGCHRMEPFRSLNPHASLVLPHTEYVSDRVIVLPTGIELPPDAVDVAGSVFSLVRSAL